MKKIYFLAVSIFIISIFFTNCKKETTDIRGSVNGIFLGTQSVTIFWSQISNLYSDSIYTIPLIMKITNNSSVNDGIIITEIVTNSPNFVFNANGVTAASNGLTFNILQQTITVSGMSATINGFENYTSGSLKFDGGYDSGTKVVQCGYSQSILFNLNGNNVNVLCNVVDTGTKQ
jgi:hypothetical protein